MSSIKVLVIDDSAFMRQIISRMLETDPSITVVGVARDGEDALHKIERLQPDVLTLDLEMPKMDGLAFLAKIMAERPLPVVVVSSWAAAGADKTIQALELGAVDFVTKPVSIPSESMWDIAEELLAKVRAAGSANIVGHAADTPPRELPAACRKPADEPAICCLAASTGGPKALQSIVARFPSDFPMGVLLVQHMPPGFTSVFACHLAGLVGLPVSEASDGRLLERGHVLIAPSGYQTTVVGGPGRLYLRVGAAPQSAYRPSADVTFDSIAKACGSHAIGVLLTGMGQDGARGLLAMRRRGAKTIAESGETCVVHGMSRVAAEIGAADLVLPLWQIPEAILAWAGLARV